MGNETLIESPTSDRGPRQKYIPKRVLLAKLTGAAGDGGVAAALIKTPDSRVRCKVTILPSNPNVDLFGSGLKVWIGGVEEDQSGPSGSEFIVVNSIGPAVTRAAPQAFPLDAGLQGYSREFVTSIDLLRVELTIPALAPATLRTITADPSDVPQSTLGGAWAILNAAFTSADVGRELLPNLAAPNAAWNVPFTITQILSPTEALVTPDPSAIGVFTSPASGTFDVIGTAGPVCDIYVQCRYQPEGQRLPWDEWDEVRKETGIRVEQKIVR
jgi:hypothetical protein